MAAKPDLGEKIICISCGAKFYSLNRTPIICPKCDTENPSPSAAKNQRGAAKPVKEVKPATPAPEEEASDEEDVTSESDADDIEDLEDIEDGDSEDDGVMEDTSDLGDDDAMDEVLGSVEGSQDET